MCGPSRKLLFGVGFMSLAATVCFIIALSTPFMITNKADGPFDSSIEQRLGWWRGCVKSKGPMEGQNREDCRNYDTDKCDLLPPHMENNDENCDKFKTVKSFGIMATAFSGGACIFLIILAFMDSCRAIPYIIAFLAVMASVACGVVSSSVYIDLAEYDVKNNGWEYNWSFGLFLTGWIINALVTLMGCVTGAACGKSS